MAVVQVPKKLQGEAVLPAPRLNLQVDELHPQEEADPREEVPRAGNHILIMPP